MAQGIGSACEVSRRTDNEAMARIGKDKNAGKTGSRDARLAAALRENLRRRKAQERARGPSPEADSSEKPNPTPHDDRIS